MKISKYFHETSRKTALSILKEGLKFIPSEMNKNSSLGRIDYRKNRFWAIKLSKHAYIKEYIQSIDENGGENAVVFFFTAPSIGEHGGPIDEHDDGMEGFVAFKPKDSKSEEVIIPPKYFYKIRINAVNYTPKEALGILKRKSFDAFTGKKANTDSLIELTKDELSKLDLDKEFWEIGHEIIKPEIAKSSSIYALKEEEKVVAIAVMQKKQIKVLQSIKKGYGTEIINALIKKLGKSLKVKEAVRGAITFYYKVGFELDRNYLDTRNGNTINMVFHNKLSDKERIKNDIDFLENEIKKIKKDYDADMQRRILRPYISTLGTLKMVAN